MTIIALLTCISLFAKEPEGQKLFYNNVYVSGGVFLESGLNSRGQNPGTVQMLSYGLDIHLKDKWSIMPGADIRIMISDYLHRNYEGNDRDFLGYFDIFCIAKCHSEEFKAAYGIGPSIGYDCLVSPPESYYINGDPSDPRNGLRKFKGIDLSLRPSITYYPAKFITFGIEGSIGLLNAMIQYPDINCTGVIHLHYVAAFFGFRF